MNKKIHNLQDNIAQGRLLEESIPPMFTYLADRYYIYAETKLALHYAAFFGAYCDNGEQWGDKEKEMLSSINQLIADTILQQGNTEMEKAITTIDGLRNEIINRMKYLTAYADVFEIYEYVLNRIEYRFREDAAIPEDEEVIKEILCYIFDTQDNAVVNAKISEMVAQLPIRMTKKKYLDYIEESLQHYEGSEGSSFEIYLYMLRTSAMLGGEDEMPSYYPALKRAKKYLAKYSFKTITEKEYKAAKKKLDEITQFLETETSFYYSLQEIVNEVYIMLLCSPYAGMPDSGVSVDEKQLAALLKEVNNEFLSGNNSEPDSLFEKFEALEGIQEELFDDLLTTDETLDEIESEYSELVQSLMVDKLMNILLRSRKLLSESLFIDLEEKDEVKTVDRERIAAESKLLRDQLEALFAEQDKTIIRAIMANTLSKIPVFFDSHTEVMDYVRYSIEGCTDTYEKAACAEIIKGIIYE